MIKLLLKGKTSEAMQALRPEGRIIIDKNKARGLTMEEINELRLLGKKGLIGKELEIKLSSAFAPAVFAAFIAANLTGDFLWLALF
ncbi:hypothetical protein HZB89_01380 [archaeon]|nr:hypothetical protein [archaeon]